MKNLGGADLEVLSLKSTNVSGSINDLKLGSIHTIDLSDTKVHGNISALAGAKELQQVLLGHTLVSGSVAHLQGTKYLQLNFSHAGGIFGDVEALAKSLEKSPITSLDLDSTKVKGSICNMARLYELRALHLCDTRVSGDLVCFQSAIDDARRRFGYGYEPNLQKLCLSFTQVTGSITHLGRAAVWLRELHLSRTAVSGSFDGFFGYYVREGDSRPLPVLEVLDLSHTNVNGELRRIETIELRELNLKETKVAGRLEDWNDLQVHTLVTLVLSMTKIRGNISALQHAENLREVDLSDTDVAGQIGFWAMKWSRLETLNLSRTDVSGSVGAIQLFRKLRSVDLSFTKVKGRPSPHAISGKPGKSWLRQLRLERCHNINGELEDILAANPRLRTLDLSGTRVNGSMAMFGSAGGGLTEVRLANTRVNGDISSLRFLPKLQALDLSGSFVSGSLWVLRYLSGLRELRLANTNVHGDILATKSAAHLKILDLSGSGVVGSIAVLQHLRELICLVLSSAAVEGDVSILKHTVKLREAWLSGTLVWGDIAVFRSLRWVQAVNLKSLRVQGNVAAFQAAWDIDWLDCSNTTIAGTIDILSGKRKLQLLSLGMTKVHGKLSALANSTNLKELVLSNSEITGDISDLHALSQLRKADLSSTHVSGDIHILKKWTSIEEIYLSRTEVTGVLFNGWHGSCKDLRILELSAAQLQRVVGARTCCCCSSRRHIESTL